MKFAFHGLPVRCPRPSAPRNRHARPSTLAVFLAALFLASACLGGEEETPQTTGTRTELTPRPTSTLPEATETPEATPTRSEETPSRTPDEETATETPEATATEEPEDTETPTPSATDTPTATATATPTLASDLPLKALTYATPVQIGDNAFILLLTEPGVRCSTALDYSGVRAGPEELQEKVADGEGLVDWTWRVQVDSEPQQITATATCEDDSGDRGQLEMLIEVTEPE